jgi:hypothetical protein
VPIFFSPFLTRQSTIDCSKVSTLPLAAFHLGNCVRIVSSPPDAFQGHFKKKFPNLSLNDFSKGPYAMSEDKMGQFEAVMVINSTYIDICILLYFGIFE